MDTVVSSLKQKENTLCRFHIEEPLKFIFDHIEYSNIADYETSMYLLEHLHYVNETETVDTVEFNISKTTVNSGQWKITGGEKDIKMKVKIQAPQTADGFQNNITSKVSTELNTIETKFKENKIEHHFKINIQESSELDIYARAFVVSYKPHFTMFFVATGSVMEYKWDEGRTLALKTIKGRYIAASKNIFRLRKSLTNECIFRIKLIDESVVLVTQCGQFIGRMGKYLVLVEDIREAVKFIIIPLTSVESFDDHRVGSVALRDGKEYLEVVDGILQFSTETIDSPTKNQIFLVEKAGKKPIASKIALSDLFSQSERSCRIFGEFFGKVTTKVDFMKRIHLKEELETEKIRGLKLGESCQLLLNKDETEEDRVITETYFV